MSQSILCAYCGSQLLWGAEFCPNCGRPIQQSQSVPYLPPTPAPQRSAFGWLQSDKNRVRALVLLAVILGGALLFSSLQNASLQSRLTILQNEASAYQTQLQSSQAQNSQLRSQVSQLQSQNGYLEGQVQSLNLQNNRPTLTIWTSCGKPCTTSQTSWLAGGVPDTFTYYVTYTADYPVGVYFLSLNQYSYFATCPSTGSVESQLACVTGTYLFFAPTTSLNGVFHLAEGCAGYVAVFYSDTNAVIHPDVTVTYNPASSTTGVCA
jgi:cell division protein FtsB